MRPTIIAALALTTLLLVGCAVDADEEPEITATATPTSTPEPEPEPEPTPFPLPTCAEISPPSTVAWYTERLTEENHISSELPWSTLYGDVALEEGVDCSWFISDCFCDAVSHFRVGVMNPALQSTVLAGIPKGYGSVTVVAEASPWGTIHSLTGDVWEPDEQGYGTSLIFFDDGLVLEADRRSDLIASLEQLSLSRDLGT